MRILWGFLPKYYTKYLSSKRVRITFFCLAVRKSNSQALRREILASFPVFCLVKSTLDFGKIQKNLSKIYSPYGAKQFWLNRFFHRQANFLQNMRIFKKKSVTYMGKSIIQNLVSSITLRLLNYRRKNKK